MTVCNKHIKSDNHLNRENKIKTFLQNYNEQKHIEIERSRTSVGFYHFITLTNKYITSTNEFILTHVTEIVQINGIMENTGNIHFKPGDANNFNLLRDMTINIKFNSKTKAKYE